MALTLSASAASLDELVQQYLSENLVTTNLLANSDAFRLGFWSFNPNEFLNLENDAFGDEESARLRKRIRILSIPYEWALQTPDQKHEMGFLIKASYVDIRQEAQFVVSDDPRQDSLQDNTLSLSLGTAWRYALDEHWKVTLRTDGHWMRYRNNTEFRSQASQPLAPALDGLLTNITVDALLVEPNLKLSYANHTDNGTRWRLFSDYHYVAGDTYNTRRSAHDANPEGWFWSNGAELTNPVLSSWLPGQTLWLRVARVDLGADLSQQMGNGHYYEAGVAWIVNTGDRVPLLDNVGLGLNFNYGSVLRGGSLVLMLNEF